MLTQSLTIVLYLLFAVVLFTTVARRLQLPYPSLLALGGLMLALIPGLPRLDLSPDFVLVVFLPPLLFGAGWRISWGEFVAQIRPISVLAVGLVLFTTVGVGFAAHALDSNLSLGAAMVLGAIISPTDPLAASAVARQVRLPRQLITILEGESLANDATGLVVYRIAVGAVLTGAFSVFGGVYTFAVVATGGVAIGLLIGVLSVQLQRAVDDPPVQFTLQLLTGYVAYLPAEHIGFSGVFAAAAAGLFCGYHWSYALGARSRLQAVAVWETLDFLLNAVLFLLLGLQLPVVLAEEGHDDLGRLVLTGVAVSLLAIVLRMAWMFIGGFVARARQPDATSAPDAVPSLRSTALLGWSGMRGVLSLATALAVPRQLPSGALFPGRAAILFYAFCVIVVTLIVQGLPLPLVIRWLKIPRDAPRHNEERLARIYTARAARDRLDELYADGDDLTRGLADEFRARYGRLLRQLEAEATLGGEGRTQAEINRIRRAIVQAQRRALLDLHRRRLIDDETFRRVERELDLEEQSE